MDQTPSLQTSQPVISVYKKPSNKKFIIPIIIIIIIVVLSLLTFYFRERLPLPNNQKSPDTSSTGKNDQIDPLYNLPVEIEKIDGNALVVRQSSINLSAEPVTQKNPPQIRNITFRVRVNDNTSIQTEPVIIPYSLKLATPSATLVKLSELISGQSITISSKEKQPVSGSEIEAVSITVSPGTTMVQGKIKEVSGTKIIIHTEPPNAPKDYQFTISNETEITGSDTTPPISINKTQLPVSSLKTGGFITIYTDKDVNLFEDLKALKIDIPL